MVTRFAFLVSSTFLTLFLVLPGAVAAEDKIEPSFREATKKFLIVQKTPQGVSDRMVYSMVNQALGSMASSGITVTEPIQEIVVEAARTTFGSRFSDIEYLTDLYTPLYVANYSEKELLELVAFWESPVGKKTIDLMPKINEGSNAILEKASRELIPEFQKAIDDRTAEAGIVLAPQATPSAK
jgi:hypothetical protein